jgi:hypothetical protein
MELLDRYLQAVGRLLPAETRVDTLAELRANLLETMDDRAEALGHPLADSEITAILKAHGRPEVVAVRYLPQRSLIGPGIFPFYVLTLKRALPVFVAIYIVARAMVLLFGHPEGNVLASIGAAIWGFWPVLLTFWAVVTLVFAVLEQAGHAMPWSDWDPAKLPRLEKTVPGEKVKSMPARLVDLVMQTLAVGYFLAVPAHPFLIIGPGAAIMRLAPSTDVSRWLYAGILALMVGQVVLRAIGLRRIGRQTDAALTIGVKVLSIATTVLVVMVKVYFVPRDGFDPTMVSVVNLTNHWVNIGFQFALLFSVVDLLWEIWKAARHGASIPTVAGRVSL